MRLKNQTSALVGMLALLGGCSGDFIMNQTEERSGNVTAIFINNTAFRASFSFGAFDSLDRNPPGAITFQQLQLEAGTTSATSTLPCRRDVAIGTAEMLQRALDTNATNLGGFNRDIFVEGVAFSSAPAGTVGSGVATDGTAKGIDAKLGVDYSCGDQLIFTFEEDATASGGFRIVFSVIPDIEPDR
ncbi:MAG: hypothetical protein HZB38_05815 [Planctomycetes bacterium]|nr:hypothetical protein [Planctomycetota bacterium]